MNKIISLTLALLATLSIYAQMPEGSDIKAYYGTKNPAKAQELHDKIFVDGKKNKERVTIDSYRDLKELIDLAPYCTYSLYNGNLYQDENSFLTRLLDSIPDPATKKVIIDDFLKLGENYINNLDSINLIRKKGLTDKSAAEKPISEPVGKIKYADMYYKLAGNPKYYPAKLYDKALARENFLSAFKRLRELNIDPGTEVEGYYISEYYKACEDLFRTDEDRYYVQFLEDYQELVKVCDNLLIPYYDIPDSIKLHSNDPKYRMFKSYYMYTNNPENDKGAPVGIKTLFKNSGAATPERLNQFFLARLDENKTDSAYLNDAIEMLVNNEAFRTKAYYDYCNASYKIKPDYNNCIGKALYYEGCELYDDMVKYYQEALRWAPNDLKKGLVAFKIGQTHNIDTPKDPDTGQKAKRGSQIYKEWCDNLMRAIANFKIVLDVQEAFRSSTSIAERDTPFKAYLGLGWATYRFIPVAPDLNTCDEGLRYARMATQANSEAIRNSANQLINNLNSVRTKITKILKDNAKNQKLIQEYQENLRKKKAEEDFWKGVK